MEQRPVGPGGRRWLALGEDALPAGEQWLAPGEAANLAGLRYTKRRTEYLLRRLVTKHAVAAAIGRPTDPVALAGIEVRNAPSGAPYVCVDGAPIELGVSITDRAGWAVCLTSPAGSRHPVGCDLELVEPRTPGFVQDFLTAAEQRLVSSCQAGDERDAAANLIWSAKESALKVLQTGLRRDTLTVEVTLAAPSSDGWGALTVRAEEGPVFPGWWRREGRFLLTIATEVAGPPPVALVPGVLSPAVPRHSWLDRPLHLR
ncbi:4'-phosphopantetheinyl transferase superfamily protein [Mycobacterium sp. Y57]|uniref:4'-phosphopantetheinyl transferase family protein n=1 Tax=Mycolicibacterium xanthum TaxID=2796469 RepID=UPI001C8504D6|nr:4'-phosphopantetheinyl transferase superfamily protein [Mycolicibacterium xanthum]MBX7435225.1 4'-phosphopantetheinyl transferase superfamily protein [Mycolicibacterium xanthum]